MKRLYGWEAIREAERRGVSLHLSCPRSFGKRDGYIHPTVARDHINSCLGARGTDAYLDLPDDAPEEPDLSTSTPCRVCCGRPLPSGRECICGGEGTAVGEAHGLRKALFAERDAADDLRRALREAREGLNRCHELFAEIRADFTDPRSECREGKYVAMGIIARIDRALARANAALGEKEGS